MDYVATNSLIFVLKYIRILIFSLSVAFLFYIFGIELDKIKQDSIFKRDLFFGEILILSILYALGLFFVSLSWLKILQIHQSKSFSICLTFIWLKSNIYKYLPGNVFNYVARQVEAKKFGVSHSTLLISNFIEAFSLTMTALLISSLVFLDNSFAIIEQLHINKYYLILIFIFLVGGIVSISIYKSINIFSYWLNIILYGIFFIGMGLIAYYVLNYQMQIKFEYFLITAVYSFAWLVGFITPGSPGGIGVRESIFIILSNGVLSRSDAIILATILRLISLAGELFLFVISTIILKKYQKKLCALN